MAPSVMSAEHADISAVLTGTCRTLGYVGLILLLGIAVFSCWVSPGARETRRARDLAGAGAVVAALVTVVTPYASGGGPHIDARQLLLSALRVALLLCAAGYLLVVPAGSLRRDRLLTVTVGVVTILSYVLLSDAWGGQLAAVKIVATFAHLLAAIAWLGGLTALLLIVLPTGGMNAVAESFRVFSPLAATCVAVLVVSGTVHAWIVLAEGTPDIGSRFALALLVKSAAVAFMLLLGNVGRLHHQRVRRKVALAEHRDGVLAAALGAELITGVAVLVATAVLVSMA